MNKELLLRVKAHILEEPRRLNMSNWIQDARVGSLVHDAYESNRVGQFAKHALTENEAPPCGTVACLAGWACVLSGHPAESGDWLSERGGLFLDLTEDQKSELFWPESWGGHSAYLEYKTCGNAEQRAQVVARVIDAFIAKYEGAAK